MPNRKTVRDRLDETESQRRASLLLDYEEEQARIKAEEEARQQLKLS